MLRENLIFALCIFFFMAACRPATSSSESSHPIPARSVTIKYQVTASSCTPDVDYLNSTGGTNSLIAPALPWAITISAMTPGDGIGFLAEVDAFGSAICTSVTASIRVDNVLFATETSGGAFALANAVGFVQ